MAEYVVEFGRDGRPVEPDGRLDAPAFHRNHRADLGGACRSSSPANPATCWRPAAAPASMWSHFARHTPEITWWPSDFNERASEEHRGVAGACGLAEHPPAAADRSVRSGLVPGDARRQRARRIAGGVLRQCDPHRAVARRRGPVRRRRALSARRRAAVSLRPVQARRQAHRAQQRRVRHQPARTAIPNGACATSAMSRSWRQASVWR